MTEKTKKSKGGSAYRIKRAKNKKPIRFLEFSIIFLLIVVGAYAASFIVQVSNGYSKENPPTEYYINLQVLNGCGEKGIANKLANKIEASVKKPLAVRIIDTDNFYNFGVEKTFIISRKSNLNAATLLATQLNIDPEVTYREIEDNYLDIGATLILGNDYRDIFEIGEKNRETR
ncbi:MAG: LytR C-terminal domain-containing protein [Candidatus Zixiibacteriota bacterium]